MKKIGKMLSETLCSLFKKPATSSYPFEKRQIHKSYIGKIAFNSSLCIGCRMCERNCPAHALVFNKIADKQFELTLYLTKCIFCAQCVDSCVKKALSVTDNFELAQADKSKLTVKL